MPGTNMLGVSTTGINYPNSDTWVDYTYTFTATTTGSNYIGFAFRQDPAYWTLGNIALVQGSVAASGTNLLVNTNFATGGSFTAPLAGGGSTTVQAPQYWGVWYQNGSIPRAAGQWQAPGANWQGVVYNGGQGVNTSTAGSWIDGAVGSYDGIYQGVSLTAGQSYTLSFSVYGNNASSNSVSGGIGLAAYSGPCNDTAALASACVIPSSAGFTTLATPAQGGSAGAPSRPDIVAANNGAANFNSVSSLQTGNYNLRFNGGTVVVDSVAGGLTPAAPATSSDNFTIAATDLNGGKAFIDQNSRYSVFTGTFADDTSNGRLIIQNNGSTTAGRVVLAPTAVGGNTYTGGTEVQSGATLSISNPNAIGSGGLDLVGSPTVAATLETTASMTIANHITVTGDPVFSVASGTTTTVSTAITGTGDVVVSGGGTLALSAVNTYTGLTAVDASSTLALTGSGSITSSSALNNSGNVDVRGANGNVALGGTLTQASTGSLLMNISPTNNQKVLVTGAATLAGNLTLTASSGTYTTGRYTLLTANGVTGKFDSLFSNLPTYTRLGYTLGYDANDVYLVLTPNVGDTQQSLVNTASALQNTYTLQNSVMANSFSYDCNLFDVHDICVSAGGRNTAIQAANGLNNTSALLIASYRLDENNSRIGAYADQNLSVNNGGSTVNLGNNTPLIGLFAAWSQRPDGTGAEVKAGIAYGQKNTTITRQVVGTSEPGSGSSQLNSQGAQLTAKYGFGVMENVIVSPYIGMRYTQNNMGGYSEATSATVTSPLTYSALNTNATTALAGIGASYHFIPEATVFASAGVEADTNTANGTYAATGLTGLTPINFNANPVRTRPTAMLGASYDVEKNQRIGITGIYRQEPFQAVSSTTVMATYTVGF
ncbi:autotransporter outer membrane beta-barrel domain-containing protein [Polynucleobacter sphagniphilus]|uniref:autotransporter outer membrane beta-barrel domain-containing protein n=1 Tax=Polynucleobacter sphagniphilus TaxID=1743169 RepID=UPI0024756609|nr:hypothetical protein [Polynucleobacter sphagniphilus]